MEGYYIEWTGDHWQSVFKSNESEKSQLHESVQDAYEYMTEECGIIDDITIIGFKPTD